MKKITLLIAAFLLTFFCYADKSSKFIGFDSDWTELSAVSWSTKSYEPRLKLQRYFDGATNLNLWNVLRSGSEGYGTLMLDEVCASPAALMMDGLSFNGARINWEGSTTAGAKYDVYYSTVSTVPTTATVPTVANVTGLTTTLNTLNSNTTYFVWVRSSCTITTGTTVEIVKGAWSVSMSFTTLATLPYSEGFEGANHGFEFGTAAHVNKWYVDTAVKSTGLKSLYISRDNGATHQYNLSGVQTIHASKSIVIPAGTQDVNVSFDWKCKGDGFIPNNALDYFKVWVVPATFVPTSGTLINTTSGGVLLRAREFNNSDIFVRENLVANLNQFAGQTVKLIFEWRNDATDGNQPPAAIDNIDMQQVTCTAPSNLTYTGLTENSVNFNWDGALAPGASFDVYYSSSPIPIIYDTQVPSTQNLTANTSALQGLTADTKYYAWVRTKCSATSKSYWAGPISFTTGQVPQQLPYVENFEGTHGWNLNANQSSTQVNKWAVGTAVHSGDGSKSLYISKDDGATHEYILNQAQASHAYRDIQVNNGIEKLILTFDWKCFGEGFLAVQRFDYFRIWMVPIDFIPTPGVGITAAPNRVRIGKDAYNNKTDFTRENLELNVQDLNLVGQRGRLVFEWINNRSLGNQPPAAIDNVELRELNCNTPFDMKFRAVTETTATISWIKPLVGEPTSYDLFYSETQIMPVATTVPNHTNIRSTQFQIPGLTRNTVYYVWLRSSCGADSKSYWIGPLKIITTQKPAVLPYTEDFETPFNDNNTWTTLFSDTTNKWVRGTAATAGVGNAMYISNNNGANHAYTLNRSQVSHVYRDIRIPTEPLLAIDLLIEFDWKGIGDGTRLSPKDYLRVWIVPTEYVPQEGTKVDLNLYGGVQVGEVPFLQSNAFVRERLEVNVREYAGRDVRLLFEWVNDNAGGSQPPAAIDNITIGVIPCPSVKAKDVGVCANPGAVEFFWEPTGDEEKWEIAAVPFNAALTEPPAASIIVVDNNIREYIFTDLVEGASYSFFIRAICGPNGSSRWTKFNYTIVYKRISEAQPFCAGDESLIFPNVDRTMPVVDLPGNIACLVSAPRPVLYYLKIREDGDLVFDIVQARGFDANGNQVGGTFDVDYVAFGPFDNLRQACSQSDYGPHIPKMDNNTQHTPGNYYPRGVNIVDCSYDSRDVERMNIFNAKRGQIYVVILTNYAGDPGFIKLNQINANTKGAGSTDCNFNCEVDLGKNQVLCGVSEYTIKARVSTGGDAAGIVYNWFKDDEVMDPDVFNTNQITVTESGTYRVVVEKADCLENPEDDVVIRFVKPFEGTVVDKVESCDPNNEGIGVFNIKKVALDAINTDPNPNKNEFEYSYHNSLAEAETGTAPITVVEDYRSVSKQIFLKLKRKRLSTCEKIFPIDLVVVPTLYPVVDFKYPAPICINNDITVAPELAENFTTGGVFAAVGEGLVINPSTGVINVESSTAGKYTIQYTFKIPQDRCGEDAMATTEIEIFERFQISYDGECSGGEYRLRVVDLLQNIDLDNAKYAWEGPENFSSDKRQVIASKDGHYSVLLTTADGCYETLNIELNRVDCLIPKGLSPNGDGINDSFDLSRYEVNSLVVYNRYGKKVYSHGKGYTNQWKGQSDSGHPLVDGTYFYEIVTATESFTGWVQINK